MVLVGEFERGPLNTPTEVFGPSDFSTQFGGLGHLLSTNPYAGPVAVRSGGVLQVLITERVPVVLWRLEDERLEMLDEGGHRVAGLAYTVGVLVSFLALGGTVLVLRAAGEQLGWGFQLQSPWVVAALALLFSLIALNLLGLLSAPAQMKLAETGVQLADQRRMATQMAVLTQVHIARQQLASAWRQHDRADAIAAILREAAEKIGKL